VTPRRVNGEYQSDTTFPVKVQVMPMPHSKREPLPSKPHPDFPLFLHATHRWAKKVKGELRYFGSTNGDPEGKTALAKYHDEITGRPAKAEGLTVGEACNRFLTNITNLVERGDRAPRTFKNYKQATDALVANIGKHRAVDTLTPSDFEVLWHAIRKGRGLSATWNVANVIRMVLKYAHDLELIDRPVRFGRVFRRPDKATRRKAKNAKGDLSFQAEQIRSLLDAADVQLKAMILLGVNCGFGNADCGQLPTAAIDLDNAWMRFPRPKTGIDRRCPLWPETVEALRQAIAKRPLSKCTADVGKVFITKYGQPWFRAEETTNPVSAEFKKFLDKLELHRPGHGFYSLRRTFETIGGGSRDQVAVDFIMGHAPDEDDMASVYRQHVDDDRLRAVADHMRRWFFPPEPKKPAKRKAAVKKRPSVKAK
jgi:integrase